MGSKRTLKKFKGTFNEYTALHNWVRKHRGKPMLCEDCGRSDKKIYEWANVSGEYKKDLSDWKRLCKTCHHKFDDPELTRVKEICLHGHPLKGDNIRYKTSKRGRITRYCLECQRQYLRNFRQRKMIKEAVT